MSSRTSGLRPHPIGTARTSDIARYANWVRYNKDKAYVLNKRCFQCGKPCAFFYCIKHEIARRSRDKHRKELKQKYNIG